MPNYKIGTRGSLLALTQCTQVKDQLESLTGDSFELVEIKTEGDENTELPLWQLDGKDFFTKELDQALLSHKVDLVVHSYKDLGSERPEGIQLAVVLLSGPSQNRDDLVVQSAGLVLVEDSVWHCRGIEDKG